MRRLLCRHGQCEGPAALAVETTKAEDEQHNIIGKAEQADRDPKRHRLAARLHHIAAGPQGTVRRGMDGFGHKEVGAYHATHRR
ncbi:MAG TPA: hypothetical protein VGA58_02150 [bacterium]